MRYVAILQTDVGYVQILQIKSLIEEEYTKGIFNEDDADTWIKTGGYTFLSEWIQSPEVDYLYMAELEKK